MSKGSTQRPQAVDEQTFAENWARVFGEKPEDNYYTVRSSIEGDREDGRPGTA